MLRCDILAIMHIPRARADYHHTIIVLLGSCPRELRQFWTPNIISFYKDDKMLTIQLFVHHIYILLGCYGNRRVLNWSEDILSSPIQNQAGLHFSCYYYRAGKMASSVKYCNSANITHIFEILYSNDS